MESPLKLDVAQVRKEAVERAQRSFTQARTTQEKHDARRALLRAQRAANKGG